jgi:regulation of enolase protein 1 (concanavalin A-like superfamily)
MSDSLNPNKDTEEKEKENSQFSKRGVYIREDDQDWGSSGIDYLEQETNQS